MVAPTPMLVRALRAVVHRVQVLVGAALLTLLMFLVLPVMETIGKVPIADTTLRQVDAAFVPPPPAPPLPEPEKPQEPEEPPPQLNEVTPPLELSQLELALSPGIAGDLLAGDFAIARLPTGGAGAGADPDALFALADLDQAPRALHQPGPVLTPELRRKAPATVHLLFLVGVDGRVESPRVQKSTDPAFEKAALAAIQQWKFEPGKRNGKPVRFRMRIPFAFKKG